MRDAYRRKWGKLVKSRSIVMDEPLYNLIQAAETNGQMEWQEFIRDLIDKNRHVLEKYANVK
jgi:hypothetical protein